MQLDFWSFILGNTTMLLGLFVLFGFIINDDPSKKALEWVAMRKNYSKTAIWIGGGIVLCAVVVLVLGLGPDLLKALADVQIWVWGLLALGLIIFVPSLVYLKNKGE